MTTQSPDGVRDLYTIPSSSGWFQWDEIHETERRSLPEFFNGGSISRNPKVYKEYRDFIINKYREDPSRRLTFTEVRKSLVGDVGSLHKLFLFLNRCGFINFGAPKLDGGVGGGPLVVLEERAPAGVEVVPAPSITSTQAASSGSAENGLLKLPPLTSYSDVFGDSMRGPVCGSCGDQCVPGPDESMEEGGFVKCVKCFENRKEVSADENLKDNSDDGGSHVNSAWTDAETLLLLEAVLKHGDDWDLIAQHVRTKDKFDCIARLVQLPFSENMSTNSGKRDNRHSNSHSTDKVTFDEQHDKENVVDDTTPVHPPKRRCFPSSLDATGSLMKQVAFLSTVGGPEVASVAAEAAVTALCNENPCAVKAFLTGEVEGTTNIELTSTNNERESLIKVEDWNTESHKLTDDKHGSVPEKNFVDMAFRIRAAIAMALGAAAARAKLMADHEEREMEHLMASIIEAQVRKVQYKMKHFEELEVIMEEELANTQMMEESILEEWVSVLQRAIHEGIIPRWERPNILC